MKLALAFSENAIAEWTKAFSNSAAVASSRIELSECPDGAGLANTSPDFIVGHESPALLEYLVSNPVNLRWVHLMSAGVDPTLVRLGRAPRPFRISNVRGIHGQAIGEYVLGAVLHFEKRHPELLEQQRERQWARFSLPLVSGKTMAVIGTGAVGSGIARLAGSIGINTLGLSISGAPAVGFARVARIESRLDEFGSVDYLVLALPLTRESKHLIARAEFAAMKKGAILVNVSRGEIIDTACLLENLEIDGKLRGVALDAFDEEPLPPDSPLWGAKKVLITPHISGKFDGGHSLGLSVFERNLSAFLSGGQLLTEVFPERGY